MNKILSVIEKNKINYHSLLLNRMPDDYSDISIVIPVRGRKDFVIATLESIKSIETDKTINITIVEHSEHSQFVAEEQWGVGLIHLPCDSKTPFNKCLCMNVGAIFGPKSQYILFHDSDLLVNKDFVSNIYKNIERKPTACVQTFADRRVLYCDKGLTNRLINGESIELNPKTNGVYDKNKPGAPGGSIFLTRRLFFMVGGFDPELFHSYSQEDLFFWDKISIFAKIESCNNPRNEVYHLDHELQQFNNPQFKDMLSLYNQWSKLSVEDKSTIVEYKRKLIQEWL
jgi:predicted glycosyltransferase involved in capsule biosynthesis